MTSRPTFTVLVSSACTSCAEALAVARRFGSDSGAVVEVVDVGAPLWVPPQGFVGTPMVYLADSVVSYGSPTRSQLAAALEQEATPHDRR